MNDRVKMAFLGLFLCAAGAMSEAGAQDRGKKPAAHPGVDQRRVDEAIRKGLEYLKSAEIGREYKDREVELALLTMVTAGVPEGDAKFQELFKEMMAAPLEKTYNVAVMAMVLEELDRAKYQPKIFHCAQFLVDNQNAKGGWRYGEPTELPPYPGTATPAKTDVSTSSKGSKQAKSAAPGARVKPPIKSWIPVKQQRTGKSDYDNSNSQYAALGLRACHDSGILLPPDVIVKAREHWVKDMVKEGAEAAEKPGPRNVASGTTGDVGAWRYFDESHKPEVKGSMTAGAVGAICIYDFILGRDWKKDPETQAGMNWLSKHFTVTENPGQKEHHYYYLYGLERAGMLYDTDRIGPHDWYKEGASFLLDAQRPDGSWATKKPDVVQDTCFAILFLKRATRTFSDVASIDVSSRPKANK